MRHTVETRKFVCRSIKKKEYSIRGASKTFGIASSTICRWMKNFKADPSFTNKNQRNCDFVDINVPDYLDSTAVQSAIAEIDRLDSMDDESVIYKGCHMEKDMYMYLIIEDLAKDSCQRRGKLPFATDELDYKIIENIRINLMNEYDATSSDSETERDDSF